MRQPSDFKTHPYGSVAQKSEAETVALNIMKILARTGNVFRAITYEEYKAERLKDGDYNSVELLYFDNVKDYCKNEDTAQLFCQNW